ncbi:MAG: hypothetical protein VKO64_11620 [Candidatus Sericytochromatia bacterium]|nr:hypothetical protein [Candidatus Sericytochromatia bacterium]
MRTEARPGHQPAKDLRRSAGDPGLRDASEPARPAGDRLALEGGTDGKMARRAATLGIVAAAVLVARKVGEAAEAARARVTGALKGLLLSKPIAIQAERQEAAGVAARQERRRKRQDEQMKAMVERARVEADNLAETLAQRTDRPRTH